MRTLLCLLIATVAAWSAPAFAQSAVSRAIVDGKTVILYDDFSWDYEKQISPECKVLTKKLNFCDPTSRWKSVNLGANQDVTATYRYNDNLYAMVIAEDLGVKQGVSKEAMRNVVIQNAATGSGVSPEEVLVLDSSEIDVKGLPAANTAYSVKMGNLDLTYINTIVVMNDWSVQLISYTIGKELTETHKKLHRTYLSYFEFAPDAEPKEDTDQKDDTELQE